MSGVMSVAIRDALKGRDYIKDKRHWEELVDFTLDELLEHVRYWKSIQGLSNQPIEIHHINEQAESIWRVLGDLEWRRLWALSNLMPLTYEDHKAAQCGDFSGLHPIVIEAIESKRGVTNGT
jgi:hypothetical protein